MWIEQVWNTPEKVFVTSWFQAKFGVVLKPFWEIHTWKGKQEEEEEEEEAEEEEEEEE